MSFSGKKSVSKKQSSNEELKGEECEENASILMEMLINIIIYFLQKRCFHLFIFVDFVDQKDRIN